MKIIKSLFTVVAFFAVTSLSAQSINEKWSQLANYGELLNKTLKESKFGNLGPIKNYSVTLYDYADAMNEKNIPSEYANPKNVEMMVLIKRQTKMVNELVLQKASDAEITKALTRLENTYKRYLSINQSEKK